MVWEAMLFKQFHDKCHGGHLGYQNRMMIVNQILHDVAMPIITFGFIQHCLNVIGLPRQQPYLISDGTILDSAYPTSPNQVAHILLLEEISFD